MPRRTYRYRLYPTRAQAAALEKQLGEACDLYNAALEQRRDAWRDHGRNISFYDQSAEVKDLRAAGTLDPANNAWSQATVLRRLDRAFAAFYRRVKAGEAPGYPRFRSRGRFDTLTWSFGKGAGCHVKDGRLALQNVGPVRVRWHREIPAEAVLREASVRRSAGRWYVCFSLDVPVRYLPETGCEVGIDVGITTFAATSHGELLVGPRAYRKAEAELRVAHRRVARRQLGSNRRAKAVLQLQRKHEHVRRIRADHAHKLAHGLVNDHDLIAVEDLDVRGLIRGRLAKDVHDQGWAQFVSFLRDKAECAGREVVLVDPRYTSQRCSACGRVAKKPLSQRVHMCPCGHMADRDVNAACNILDLARGHRVQASTVGEEVHAVA